MKFIERKKPVFMFLLLGILLILIIFIIIMLIKRPKSSIDKDDWIELDDNTRIESTYDLNLELFPDDMTMEGEMLFTYYNDEGGDVDSLRFHLYANSFNELSYGAIDEGDYSQAYPNGFSPGSIEIISVKIEGGGNYKVMGEQNHLLEIKLDETIKPKKTTDIMIKYKVTVPNCLGRFGYGDNTISLVNCNPILVIYDEEFIDYPYYAVGDPFYSECADYKAMITVPDDYTIAVTGNIKKTSETRDKKTYIIDAPDRRDFGFIASDNFEVVSTEINDVKIMSYSFSGSYINDKALDAALNAIDIFSEKYGEYPYKDFSVVETDFYIGGMEYPGMVLIDTTYYTKSYERVMEMIIVHETGHQWWYAQVGNDQVLEPWLDEALTEFSTRVYYEERYEDMSEKLISDYVDYSYEWMHNNLPYQVAEIDSSINDFDSSYLYSLTVYGEGSYMLVDLRNLLGSDMFFEIMQKYLKDNRFEIASREDFERAIEDVYGIDITAWMDEALVVEVGTK